MQWKSSCLISVNYIGFHLSFANVGSTHGSTGHEGMLVNCDFHCLASSCHQFHTGRSGTRHLRVGGQHLKNKNLVFRGTFHKNP
jgi:hypothetical protein